MGESIAEVAAIAAKLTKAQRAIVVRQQGSHSDVVAPEIEPLWYCIAKLEQGRFSISLTRLGCAVRDYLEPTDHAR